ncbi:MAG: LysR family transcriptional regulator [Pseudomonadota bacterium]
MTLEQIKAFDAVVKHGSIRAASTKIFKTPPTICSAIKCLEEDIGVSLFVRDTYRLTLSEDGIALHSKIQKILQSVTDLKQYADSHEKSEHQKITAEFCDTTPDEVKSRVLEVVGKEFPEFKLRLKGT